jgi:hypothetical protein
MFELPFGVREGNCRYGRRKEWREAFGVRGACSRFLPPACNQECESAGKVFADGQGALQTLARFPVPDHMIKHDCYGLRRHDDALAALFGKPQRKIFNGAPHFTVKPKRRHVSAVQGCRALYRNAVSSLSPALAFHAEGRNAYAGIATNKTHQR